MLIVSLVSRGSPLQTTGGHLYHHHMVAEARTHGAVVERITAGGFRNPLRGARGVVLVDSLTAWSVAPWLILGTHRERPLAAIVHQPPGGVDQGPIRTSLQRPLDQALYRRCDLLIATSAAFACDLADTWHLPVERIRVVEPGRDLPTAASVGAQDLRRGRRIAVLNVANWWPNKGVLEVLEAVAALPLDRVTVHLVGREDVDPGYGGRVHARLRAPDLAGRVVVHGSLSPLEVGRLYADADVFVSASVGETYGIVFGEALAAALPIVGWRTGNLPNLIEDGREGRLVSQGDVAGLSRALERLSTDDVWRRELAAAAQRRGVALPTWSDTADGFFGALSRLAEAHG